MSAREDELCARCGFTYDGHISNTGVPYPCWTPSGTFKPKPTTAPTSAKIRLEPREPSVTDVVRKELRKAVVDLVGEIAAGENTGLRLIATLSRLPFDDRREFERVRDAHPWDVGNEKHTAYATRLRDNLIAAGWVTPGGQQ